MLWQEEDLEKEGWRPLGTYRDASDPEHGEARSVVEFHMRNENHFLTQCSIFVQEYNDRIVYVYKKTIEWYAVINNQ